MGKFRQKLVNLAAKLYIAVSKSALRQEENLAAHGESIATLGMPQLLRRAAAEGAVLLKNDGTLPLSGKIALFGRVQADTFYTGYGSGGDVQKFYRVSILDGLKRAGVPLAEGLERAYRAFSERHPVRHGGWGEWPRSYPELRLREEDVRRARAEAETAVVVIGRASGEDRDAEPKKGSYYLSDGERELLALVTGAFSRVVAVLNIGSVIDLKWLEEYNISAALLIWQGGMETGNACADLLTGKVNPCGKLADTVARDREDYPAADDFGNVPRNVYGEDVFVGYRHFETNAPEKVLFPFGFGLSYTKFDFSAKYENGVVKYAVRNVGDRAGREVLQVYVQKPSSVCPNPARELAAFRKTKLLAAGEEERGELPLDEEAFLTFSEEHRAYVRAGGEYRIFAGTDVRSAREIAAFGEPFRIVKPVPALTHEFPLPSEPVAPSGSCTFSDVKAGRATVEQFVSQFSDEELEAISYGALKMNSPLGASGNAGVAFGVTEALRRRGIPPVTMTDGPSGIRLKTASSLLPAGTLLACTFDPDLVAEVYRGIGGEMRTRGSHVLLAPGMNLHRDPLCGRNYEYFSEDPLITGKMGAAAVRGVQSTGAAACPKHFACNNQEFNRSHNDSRVSERALRELYLRGFGICVREAHPLFLMTSYNRINGVYVHYNAALVRGVLKGEWGYEGCVITDWWMKKGGCPTPRKLKNNAARIYAGVNILMPGAGYAGKRYQLGGVRKGLGRKHRLTRGELVRNACEIVAVLLKLQIPEV